MDNFNFIDNQYVLITIFIVFSIVSLLLFINVLRRQNKKIEKPPEKKVFEKESAEKPLTEEQKWFERLKLGLKKTHQKIVTEMDNFFMSKQEKLTREDIFENLFEILVQADVGVNTSEFLVKKVKNRLAEESVETEEIAKKIQSILREEIYSILAAANENVIEKIGIAPPHVVLLVGVNGVGKTTTTGKLAFKAHARGQKVVIGAADTFRAAAIEQLAVWAQRSNAEMIRLKEGADPASVAFETTKKALENGVDLCLIDTAGRLQNRQDLMQELSKIGRVLKKAHADFPHEVLLVLDATTGQNAMQQAKFFKEAVSVTGLVLTKLDGTAKGGIAIAIAAELKLPIRYVGVGESVEDLEVFEPREFVDALFA